MRAATEEVPIASDGLKAAVAAILGVLTGAALVLAVTAPRQEPADTDLPAVAAAVLEPSPAAAPASRPPPDGPNVLFLMWDTARADRMSLYGHDRATTPRMDAFASEARVYDAAYAPSFWTVPSHASLFTGMPVGVHRTNAHSTWLRNRYTTLAEQLNDNGWDTWMFSANPNLSEQTNLIQGFDTVLSQRQEPWMSRAVELTEAKLIPEDASTERSPAWQGKRNRSSKDIGPLMQEALLGWLDERDAERPWFAFINYMEVHGPRLPGRESREGLLPHDLVELGLATRTGFTDVGNANHGRSTYSEAERDAMRGVYDASMVELDATTGDLLDALAQRGVLDDTIVVLVSDHGEAFGEHGLYGHNYHLYNELIRVPMLIRYPERITPGRVEHPVSIRDLFAAVLELTGVPVPATPFPVGNVLASGPRDHVFAELTAFHGSKPGMERVRDDGTWHPLRRRFQVVIRDEWKLILASDDNDELYHLGRDPGERTDVHASQPDVVAELELAHAAWREQIPEIGARTKLTPEERRQKRTAGADTPLEELEALGYVQ
ncbi:MAG: arylsulfatase A-like enzyme [Myxococcota bacterium]|jgi:arylsulfatase A-like enzyme